MNILSPLIVALVLGTFNLPILIAAVCIPFIDQIGKALKEKTPLGAATDATSYSRVTGALGAVVVTALFWAIGNVLLLKMLTNVGELKLITDNAGRVFLIGSALFMPYAFNQLRAITSSTAASLAGSSNRQTPAAQGPSLNEGAAPASSVGSAAAQSLTLAVANLSTSIDDATLSKVLSAISVQIARDFAPEWGIGASLRGSRVTLSGPQAQLDAATDAILYLGDSSQDPTTGISGVAGYHAQNRANVPYGFVYLDVCNQYNETWSCTLSHEILELLADPTAALTVAGPDLRVPRASPPSVNYHLEVCDPTNGDTYLINDVVVSNFVTKKYFGMIGGCAATNCQALPLAPFSVRAGGYVQFDDGNGVEETDGSRVDQRRIDARALLGPYRRNARRAARLPRRQGSRRTYDESR